MLKLGFGLMRLPLTDSNNNASIDGKRFAEMADKFLEQGFTYFDTAYMYHDGMSERAFKKAVVDRYPREAYTLTDKMPTMMVRRREDLDKFWDEQLKRTGAGYFDYYWLHNLNSVTYPVAQKTDAFDYIVRKKQQGLIRHIGFSYHDTAEMLDRILTEHPETEYVQLQINYLDWEDAGVQSRECYETCVKHGKKVMVMEPIKGGRLAKLPAEAEKILREVNPDASPASWAVRFAASPEEVLVVLSGMSDMNQLTDNTAYMKDFKPLSSKEYEAIAKVTEILKAQGAVPCTACRYCVAGCPVNIPIPAYLALYNNRGDWNQRMYYEHHTAGGGGKASECIGCRQCERACPQHIKISELMPLVAEAFE